MTTRWLHLIKHAAPAIVPGVPAHEWTLSEAGRRQARAIAARFAARVPDRVVTSEEPKAVETGELLGEALGIPVRRMLGLHEHLRYTEPHHARAEQFTQRVHALFARPSERVMGEETADEAHQRFRIAVHAALAANPGELAIVAHGTVIALLVARANGRDVTALWDRLGLADQLTVRVPDLRLLD